MKELLIQTARRTGLIDGDKLAEYFENNKNDSSRIDELLLRCPYFTEESILKLFASALGWEYFENIKAEEVPHEFVESIPAAYAQHHSIIGVRRDGDNGELVVVLSKPLDSAILDNVSKMLSHPVKAGISSRTAVTAAIDVAYEQRSTVIEEVAEELDSQNIDQLADEVVASDDLLDVVNRPPVIRQIYLKI